MSMANPESEERHPLADLDKPDRVLFCRRRSCNPPIPAAAAFGYKLK